MHFLQGKALVHLLNLFQTLSNFTRMLTSLPVAPAADVECEEDGDGVLGPGDDAVEADRLRLDLTVHGAVLVSLDVGAELRGRVEPTL